jgi:hypothetical protein
MFRARASARISIIVKRLRFKLVQRERRPSQETVILRYSRASRRAEPLHASGFLRGPARESSASERQSDPCNEKTQALAHWVFSAAQAEAEPAIAVSGWRRVLPAEAADLPAVVPIRAPLGDVLSKNPQGWYRLRVSGSRRVWSAVAGSLAAGRSQGLSLVVRFVKPKDWPVLLVAAECRRQNQELCRVCFPESRPGWHLHLSY